MPQNAKKYSSRLYDAIGLATKAHHSQVRKGTEIPYIVHPLAVAGLLIRSGCPEHMVIAALLHDVLEDTPVTVEEIRSHFGREVAELVMALSEPDKKAPWEERPATRSCWSPWPTSWTTFVPFARGWKAMGRLFGNDSIVREKNRNGTMNVWRRSSRRGSAGSRP